MNNDERLFTLLIYIAVGMIAWTTAIGGLMALLDEEYTYGEYLSDLASVWTYLVTAVIAVLLRSLVRTRNGNGKND